MSVTEPKMFTNFPLFPRQASIEAVQVDDFYFFMLAVTAFFSLLIAVLVVFFAVKYRRRHKDEVGVAIHGSLALELLWTVIPFFILMVMFVWGAKIFFTIFRPTPGAMEVYVVGKQWMWKAQHMEGQREINELHVPVGRPVKLIMASEDVIHSFFIPAFRVKADVVPGRYQVLSFTASQAGTYHLFCTQYCGTKHSGMVGSVVAMEPQDFQTWLGGGNASDTPAAAGEKLFTDLACSSCHTNDATARAPQLKGAFGSTVTLANGTTVVADEAYIRESILNPQAKVVAGFQPIMPTFQGLVTEEQLLQLIAYLRSLSAQPGSPGSAAPASSTMPQSSDRPAREPGK